MFHQFRRLRKLDKREGMVPEGFELQDEAAMKIGEDSLERLLYFTYASCWSMSDHENALMWKAYAPEGIAIKTTVGKLTAAKIVKVMNTDLRNGASARLEQLTIEYSDNWAELERKGYSHNGIPLNMLFLHLKRRAFSSEAEIRFRIQSPENFPRQPDRGYVSPNPSDSPHWCPVTFSSLDWIDCVVTAPSVSEWAAKTIGRIAEAAGLRFCLSGI